MVPFQAIQTATINQLASSEGNRVRERSMWEKSRSGAARSKSFGGCPQHSADRGRRAKRQACEETWHRRNPRASPASQRQLTHVKKRTRPGWVLKKVPWEDWVLPGCFPAD